VVSGGEPAHVHPDLGDHDLGRAPPYPRDGAQPPGLLIERGDHLLHLGIQTLDGRAQVVDVVQVHLEQERVVRTEPALQCAAELGDLGPHPGAGHVRQHLGVPRPRDERLEHLPGRLAEHVGDHRVELDARVFQELLDALGLLGPVLDELLAVPGQVPEPRDHRGRHERASKQPALQQLGQPGRIGHVGLASGYGLHVLGVHEQQLEAGRFLQDVPDRPPVDAGCLHGHLGDPLGRQPVPQSQEVIGERRELPDLLGPPPVRS
jgi:hypothetical protein